MKIRFFNAVFAVALAAALFIASPVQARDRSGAVDKCGDAIGKLQTQELAVTKAVKDMDKVNGEYMDLVAKAAGNPGTDEEPSEEEKAADDFYEKKLEPAINAWEAANKKATKLRKSVAKLCSGKEIDIIE